MQDKNLYERIEEIYEKVLDASDLSRALLQAQEYCLAMNKPSDNLIIVSEILCGKMEEIEEAIQELSLKCVA